MPIPPKSAGKDKPMNAKSLSRAMADQVQKYDRWRVRRDEKIELIPD
jgi:hypothetical protein